MDQGGEWKYCGAARQIPKVAEVPSAILLRYEAARGCVRPSLEGIVQALYIGPGLPSCTLSQAQISILYLLLNIVSLFSKPLNN